MERNLVLWLATDGEVQIAERRPLQPRRDCWLPAWRPMGIEEARKVVEALTVEHPDYPARRIYIPQVPANDPEVLSHETARVDAPGLLLARFSVDVDRTFAKVTSGA